MVSKAVEEASKSKDMPKDAKSLLEGIKENPSMLKTLQQEASKITKAKCVGTYGEVPYEVLDDHQASNVLRELNQKLVQEKVETIGEEWDNFTLVVGCVDSSAWEELEHWMKEVKDPRALPAAKVETLDGQHRREAAKKLQASGKVPAPKVLLQLYVDLDEDEKVTITNNLFYMQSQQEKPTLVNLLRMLRSRWIVKVFDKNTDPAEADRSIMSEFNFNIAAATNSIKAEEAKRLA